MLFTSLNGKNRIMNLRPESNKNKKIYKCKTCRNKYKSLGDLGACRICLESVIVNLDKEERICIRTFMSKSNIK